MAFQLRNDIHYADTGVHIILLDLGRNRYFSLPPDWNEPFRSLASGTSAIARSDISHELFQAGLFEEGNGDPPVRSACLSLEPLTSLAFEGGRPSVLLHIDALVRQYRIRQKLKTSGLKQFVHPSSQADACPDFEPEAPDLAAKASRLIKAIQATAYFISQADNCLVRSLALAQMLRQYRVNVRCTVGVRAAPFSAHAWVQHSTVVLGDTIANVRRFKPILVI